MPRPINPNADHSFLTVRVPTDLRLRLDAVAKSEERTAAAVVRRALEQYLAAEEKKNA